MPGEVRVRRMARLCSTRATEVGGKASSSSPEDPEVAPYRFFLPLAAPDGTTFTLSLPCLPPSSAALSSSWDLPRS